MALDPKALADKAGALGDAALPPMLETTELHIDGDYAAYYFSGKDETTFGDARSNALRTFGLVKRLAGAAGRSIIHLTEQGSHKGHRYAIATVKPYQGQRDADRRPKNWAAMREWLEAGGIEGYRVVTWPDREADDGVAAAARYAWESGHTPAIFSRDKDFRMIPGRHIDWTTLDTYETTPYTWALDTDEADSNGPIIYGQKAFWLQMLAGDSADNIPGLEGQPAKVDGKFKKCGGACAHAWLSNSDTPEQAFGVVAGMYQSYYGQAWPERFVEQAALLWLRTDTAASIGDFLRTVPLKAPELAKAVRSLERRIGQ